MSIKLKKLFSLIMSLVMFMSMFAVVNVSIFAQDDVLSYFTYVINDGKVAITDCDESISGDVIIPDKIEGYPVTAIGDSAFSDCTNLNSITIPDTVTELANGVFVDCENLKTITIPAGIESLGACIFVRCSNLETVYWNAKSAVNPEGWSATQFAEAGTSGDGFDIIFGDTVEVIPSHLLHSDGGTNVKSITIGKNVKEIGVAAFSSVSNLKTITVDEENKYFSSGENGELFNKDKTALIIYPQGNQAGEYIIPESVTEISGTFTGCNSLKSITVGKNVSTIGETDFSSCENLSTIIVDEENKYFSSGENGELFNKDKTVLIKYPIGNQADEYIIPESVTEISSYAFFGCNSLKSVVIGENVRICNYSAFQKCTNLSNITILSDNLVMGEDVFALTAYSKNDDNWDSGYLYIDSHLVDVAHSIESHVIKEDTLSICSGAFNAYNSQGMTSIDIPKSVKSIGSRAFYCCDDLIEVNISDNVKYIGDYAFFNCKNLISVTIPESVTKIGDNAFGYMLDYYSEDYASKNDGFKIYGYTGSAAETYAVDNNITFVSIGIAIPHELLPKNDNITITDNFVTLISEMDSSSFKVSVENENVQILDKDGKELAKDALVGTGSKIQILDKDGNVLSEYEVMVKSDVDGNGKITPADARLALRASANLDKLEGVFETAANYDGENTVSTSDARMILRKATGLE